MCTDVKDGCLTLLHVLPYDMNRTSELKMVQEILKKHVIVCTGISTTSKIE